MRIGIVNDSLIARVALQRAVESVPAHGWPGWPGTGPRRSRWPGTTAPT